MELVFPSDYHTAVRKQGPRVAQLGRWPAWISVEDSLVGRVPTRKSQAPGFDAGIACALDLIPREKQKLAATLHAAYTPEAVAQLRHEITELDPDSETCWWLAACSLCVEGMVNWETFAFQVGSMVALSQSPDQRLQAAKAEWAKMQKSFNLVDGVPFVIIDGGVQTAYIAGHDLGVQWVEAYGIFFLSTFHPSLGLEEFEWSTATDDQGRSKSGPVHGSRQFVKCASFDELARALSIAHAHLVRTTEVDS